MAQLERIVANEVLTRDLNEEIAEKSKEFGGEGVAAPDEPTEFLCACGRSDCSEKLALTLEEFERVHSRNDRFAVVPGHQVSEVDTVVERNDGYLVVEKKPGYKPEDIS
jgi:hypothetical protein